MCDSYDLCKSHSTSGSRSRAVTHSRRTKVKRTLEELNLIDAFLFSASTEKIQNAELVARIIVERATGRKLGKIYIETEKQLLGIDTSHRGVRLDICISEIDNEKVARVYDIEPNTYDLSVLPKRDRYNQSLSDVKLLDSGEDFRNLPEYVSIWILPDDPFGDNRMIYTVKNMVVENNEIVYNDGVTRLFLNASGRNGGTEALKSLLDYFAKSCEANVTDRELEKLHNIVTDVKHSREVGEWYMTWQEYNDYYLEQELKALIADEFDDRLAEKMANEFEPAFKERMQAKMEEKMANEFEPAFKKKMEEKIAERMEKEFEQRYQERLQERIKEELERRTKNGNN